ncbi:bifunctional phosphatase PAP2/diacylglycerol kinase family protein [Streptacidiphilus sp. P02-A3a]|uniref:bifunctional phosphatase PAP2/diacylglycerol kinase family protein n=1 Tax=Streptacidiphilus sp. P02-A3a TaxID=2704468 RepID=UPI0015FE2872|nr:bifunctional phosphatase PAP2/diacylglycerol kinase family protein [Streptacidiphilus sp. P02-A3a]QMU69706.1 phosphatase PAP2 family protein [Streptacidiphilus sp. P02-A3a]
MGRLEKLDVRLFERVAAAHPRGLDSVLPRLGRTADHGVLWLAGAAALGLSRNRGARRAAMRGIGSLAMASMAANVVAKQLTGRRRPATDTVPMARRLLRPPITTSFPSGHSASAAAFAAGVTLEAPWLGAAAIPLAAAVAASRVYTGAHYPGDVIAGAALGTAMAALTLRWWPLRDDSPAKAAGAWVDVPALPAGQGLIVVVNSSSGSSHSVASELRAQLPQVDLRVREEDQDLRALLEQAATDVQARGAVGALGVVGGDGTVNAAALVAAERRLPLAVFPGGTLNHFAADLGIFTLRDAVTAVQEGHGGSVDLGRVTPAGPAGGEESEPEAAYFLNTFSIGAYSELVRARESLQKYLGKWPALGVGLVRVLAQGKPTRAVVDGVERNLWLLFAGNGRYDPPGFAPTFRRSLDDGTLDIRAVDGSHPLARTRLVAAFLTGTLSRSRVYQAATVSHLRIDGINREGINRTAHYSRDGEIAPATETLILDKAPHALNIYLPHRDPA